MPLVKVGRNGQITIPKELRAILGIQEGDVLEIGIQGGNIILKPGSAVDTVPAGQRFFEAMDEIRAGMTDADP
ncbi:AbrB/MazE/SpoVT family DNA-binding domain-containing protein, partial [Desulfococcus sp.]|uniref:AbrB/MazE/SpoVT family DNA-binding domain-containing protein n=1 Tax=Desulfococcus sp. TaxID=2025834 RepID=UPI003592F681